MPCVSTQLETSHLWMQNLLSGALFYPGYINRLESYTALLIERSPVTLPTWPVAEKD